MTPIAQKFAEIKQAGRMAFMPFVTAGDPDLSTTLAIVREMAERGVDLVEVGFPYSDPIADGPVIQASYTRVLESGLPLDDIFAAFGDLTRGDYQPLPERFPPLVAMVSYAIIFRRGPERFVEEAKDAGFAGLIVPDLPAEEAGELKTLTDAAGLDLIQLVAPTTSDERAAAILATTSGFVYCVSVAGTTGARETLPEALSGQLERLRAQTDLPLAVGFGISRPEQVEALRGKADGVIVGSAIVRMIEELSNDGPKGDAAFYEISEFAAEMVAAVRGG